MNGRAGWAAAALAAGAVAAGVLLSGIGHEPVRAQGGPPPAPPVTVAPPVRQTVVETDEYVGRFVALERVEIRARVSGYLDKTHFRDGELVKKGDLLFTIDRRPFQAALDQARAELQRARVRLDLAEAELKRGEELVRQRAISESIYEQRLQTKREGEAALASAEAAVRRAELELEFTELRAPVAGRIGDAKTDVGNLVTGGTQGNTTLLATIVSLDPILFEFTTDEQAYLRYGRMAQDGTRPSPRLAGLPVKLKLMDEREFAHAGTMDFVDNVIDDSSGTIRARARFDNGQGLFTPGMFGRLQIAGSGPYEALLVPDVAVAADQTRRVVMTVNAENTVVPKVVTLGPVVGNGLRVIRSGLTGEERVVVNGLMRARPGAKVTPQPPPAAGAPPAQAPAGAPARTN